MGVERDVKLDYDVVSQNVGGIRAEVVSFSEDLGVLADFVKQVLTSWTGRGADFYAQRWGNFHTAAQDLVTTIMDLLDGVDGVTTSIVQQVDHSAGLITSSFDGIQEACDDVQW